ncbi:glucodextranase DOMON-like domain-containing protein [Nonomuraea sp. LPB2021202275-12-8]|uniref:glucodextranase DOMON-like domain-containing protein n=1 Tax=Nonomuraea sp. LPB2021202275-12-8 TaxID=3120159 RepID=UPI00300D8457
MSTVRQFALALLVAAALAGVPAAPALGAAPAPSGPGAPSHFGLARKDCVGTATGRTSKVWYTVAGGVLSDVYEPTIDNTNVETMQFAVTDGSTFTELQSRDTTYTVRTDRSGMTCTVTSTSRNGRYELTTTYLTDPGRDAVVVRTRLRPAGLRLYVRLDASVNGNGGGGPANGGADSGVVDGQTGAPVISDPNTETSAPNRDYAVPTHLALRAERRLPEASVAYAGTPGDGAAQLDADRALTPYTSAPDGNVVATARLPLDGRGEVTFALGFGRTAAAALRTAGEAAGHPFAATRARYEAGWAAYDAGLRRPPGPLGDRYRLSANVLKASEDKTFPGAVVASLGSPWGQAVGAGTEIGGKAVYFGSYREVFARDLYETFTAFLTAGDLATARATTRFLLERQQLPDGRMPRNSLLNGRLAPDSGGDQLDETAYPILMAYQSGLGGELWERVRAAADFLVAHGPAFGVERWEEQSGHSPSTIAAEIAGLVAGAEIAAGQGDQGRARLYRATADHFARSVKAWTVTTTGPYAPRYFLRLSRAGDPDAATSYNLGNGGPTEDQRRVVDAGFLELTRLGILPPDDPDVLASLPVVDRVLRRTTPNGPGWYRYGSDTGGTEDGYGECYEPDPTSCAPSGSPWPTTNSGSGHLWPVLSGERAEHALQTRDPRTAGSLLAAMHAMSSGTGLIPEQAWENPDLPASPYGADPATASIGLRTGGPTGSASPLSWAQAQQVRLILSLAAGRPLEQPDLVRRRYADHGMPQAAPLTVTAPADGATPTGASVTVEGTTTPGARVDIAAAPTDTGAPAQLISVRAGSTGAFTAEAPVSFGEVALTVTATAGGRTAYARRTVVGDIAGATTVLDVADPDGDDDGPGTYAYPTAADFQPGAFDLRRFQVITDATTVYLRAELRDLTPTFGNQMGAQLLDVYVQDPAVAQRSTEPAFPQRNYRIAEQDAWTQRVEAQGFAAPVWVTAAGTARAGAAVRASGATRTITIALPRAAFGSPGPGWRFAVVLTGQDGFSADQARGFTATPEPYQFGVCAPGGTAPLCASDPGGVPKALDVIVPAGQSQADLLNPLLGQVTLRSVTVP